MAETTNVIETREVKHEAIGALEQWMDDYTAPWADGWQRRIFVHATDYENGYLVIECAKVGELGPERTTKRFKITITVERSKEARL